MRETCLYACASVIHLSWTPLIVGDISFVTADSVDADYICLPYCTILASRTVLQPAAESMPVRIVPHDAAMRGELSLIKSSMPCEVWACASPSVCNNTQPPASSNAFVKRHCGSHGFEDRRLQSHWIAKHVISHRLTCKTPMPRSRGSGR